MKPSEMNNEELADAIELDVAERLKSIAHLVSDDYHLEASTRLRNSIPKPVVRFTPPTVDEVPDDDWCFVRMRPEPKDAHEFWEQSHGDEARACWPKDYDAWLPKPTALGLEGGE